MFLQALQDKERFYLFYYDTVDTINLIAVTPIGDTTSPREYFEESLKPNAAQIPLEMDLLLLTIQKIRFAAQMDRHKIS